MNALERVSANAARVAEATAVRHLYAVPGRGPIGEGLRLAGRDENVVSLAAARTRRSGHPAGTGIIRPNS